MITRFRKRAVRRLGVSNLLLLLLAVLISLRKFGIPDFVEVAGGLALGISASILYIQGCFALAKAKGHSDAVVPAIVLVAPLCLGSLWFLIPFVLLFGLEDKTKS